MNRMIDEPYLKFSHSRAWMTHRRSTLAVSSKNTLTELKYHLSSLLQQRRTLAVTSKVGYGLQDRRVNTAVVAIDHHTAHIQGAAPRCSSSARSDTVHCASSSSRGTRSTSVWQGHTR